MTEVDGNWAMTMEQGGQSVAGTLVFTQSEDSFELSMLGPDGRPAMLGTQPFVFTSGQISGVDLFAEEKVKGPLPIAMKIVFKAVLADGQLAGSIKMGLMGTVDFTASRAGVDASAVQQVASGA